MVLGSWQVGVFHSEAGSLLDRKDQRIECHIHWIYDRSIGVQTEGCWFPAGTRYSTVNGYSHASKSHASKLIFVAFRLARCAAVQLVVFQSFYRPLSPYLLPVHLYLYPVAAHAPTITMTARTATVTVNHPQSDAHHIAAIWITDQAGTVVGFVELDTADAAAPRVVEINVPATSTAVPPWLFCNLYGLWVGMSYTFEAQQCATPVLDTVFDTVPQVRGRSRAYCMCGALFGRLPELPRHCCDCL